MSAEEALLKRHSADGVALILGRPSVLVRVVNALVALLLVSIAVWAYFAKIDVIVSAAGSLVPEGDLRRVYAPIDGELVAVYASVGAPVQAGDIVARIKARGAIDAAGKLVEAKLQLAEAELEYRGFPAQRALMQQRAQALQQRYEFLSRDYEQRRADGLVRLAEAQRARLVEAQSAVERARRARANAEEELAQYERLFQTAGGGGVSRLQVEQKRNALLDAEDQSRTADARLAALEYELNNTLAQADEKLATAAQQRAEAKIELDTLLAKMEREEARVELRFRSASAAAKAAEELSFENFDDDNFLKIYSPTSGVVTELPFTQPGDKVRSSEPLMSVAPGDARKVLRVRIAEKDRGFVTVGQPVKIKFNAFPYQNYGLVEGRLDYVSPSIARVEKGAAPAYDGRIHVATDAIQTESGPVGLRYGMNATAEIVVRERRAIDFVLDPLRRFN
ncbi:MAG: HlyD family efflux transporter periplasmic adaptor subunit [Pseudomonadota bacterium]